MNVPDKWKHLPVGVCCVIRNEQGQLLLVSRKDDQTSFGLPGGKVDPGETPEEAVIREVKEETGLDIELGPRIYQRMCPKHAPEPEGQDFYAFAFVALSYSGEICSDEAGLVKWGSWSDQGNGRFAEYNKGVRAKLSVFDDRRNTWKWLNTESTGMGLPILRALHREVLSAQDLAAELDFSEELVTNALLHLNNMWLVSGLEGGPYRITLHGIAVLELGKCLAT